MLTLYDIHLKSGHKVFKLSQSVLESIIKKAYKFQKLVKIHISEYKKYAAPRSPRWPPCIENKLFEGEITT